MGMHVEPHNLNPLAQGKLHVLALPQTPIVLGAVGVQLALEQQPAFGTHMLVTGQGLKPVEQLIPHMPPLQTAVPFDGGAAHETHVDPQKSVLVSD